ncbi:uncharacterized protein LOC121374012 [Gigantopelta aegis]|uniref:uncharacterized protein LOC121374012 n=1 Tax=Gigantopelta aegis TaxID=1735272 RepID=UPI001B88778B|nr:uncharacterized protein LOC121374012 [Gigantopelta aegis]
MFKLRVNHYISIILFIVIACILVSGSDQSQNTKEVNHDGTSDETAAGDHGETKKLSGITKFKKLFSEHRVMQLNAIKSLQHFGDYTQRFKLVEIMLQQLFSVMSRARANLTEWGHLPGDPFPDNETIQE